jgi:HSP20 family protein
MSTQDVVSISPNTCFDTDEDNATGTMEISLPGVKKEDITLKINEEGYSLTAVRGETKFASNEAFCCPVDPKGTTAKYENGLLSIKVKFKDYMEDAVTVPIA